MATVRITDTVTNTLTRAIRNQFSAAISAAETALRETVREATCTMGATALTRQAWGEHTHLMNELPEEWLGKPNYIRVRVTGPSVTNMLARAWLDEPEPEPTTSMADFGWGQAPEPEPEQPAQPERIPLSAEQYAYDTVLFNESMTRAGAMAFVNDAPLKFPPSCNGYEHTLVVSLDALCPAHDDRVRLFAKVCDMHDLVVKQDSAGNAMAHLCRTLPSVNRLLKEYPQYEPLIPDDLLAKVREKANRRTSTGDKPDVGAPDQAGLDALKLAAALTGLNK